jgi:nicotinate dehydrogenase subunit B
VRKALPKPPLTLAMTADATAALERAEFSRRDFLKASGALIVSFSLWGVEGFSAPAHAQAFGFPSGAAPNSPPLNQLDSWIAISSDGAVTAYSGKEELGQGIVTAQTQLISEELCVPIDRVTLICCDTALTPDQGYTSGSQSHPSNFNKRNLALAGATAREALLRLGSERLGMPVEQLVAVNGVIRGKNDPSKTVSYGELVGGKKFNIALDADVKRKPANEWTVLGTPVHRLDMPALVTGQVEFVHSLRVPGMLHGRVVRPPSVGATLLGVDEESVAGLPGLVKVVVKKDFVGVVAAKPWQAVQAANKLKATWSSGTGLPNHEKIYEYLRNQKPTRDTLLVDSADVDRKISEAVTVLKATYHHPYQMHGSVGSSCAVADVQPGRATIWSSTQAVWFLQNTAAMVLNLKPEDVRVIFTRGSGCYGLNGVDTISYDAALLSQAVGKPVRVQYTRKEEMAWENFGQALVMDERAGIDAQGNIVAWDCESWLPTLGGRPGTSSPGNVITGFLIGFAPDAFVPRIAPPPATYNNVTNAVPSYVTGCVGAACRGKGTIKSERVLVHTVVSPFWTAQLRAPQRLQNTFAHECFMDELSARMNVDPIEYRLRHLRDPRLLDVVKAAAKVSNWQTRPSPRVSAGRIASGRGCACVAYEGDNGFAAMVVEAEVDRDTGQVVPKRMVISADCGPISNPDGLRNQLEGGALQGLSRALMEEVTWDNEKITSFDWRSYHVLPLGFDVPSIETVLLNRPGENATGAGELSITIVAGALGNAIFDATGARIREIPFTPERVKAALAS